MNVDEIVLQFTVCVFSFKSVVVSQARKTFLFFIITNYGHTIGLSGKRKVV